MIVIGHQSDSIAPKYENITGCQIGSLKPGIQADLFTDKENFYGGNYMGLNQYSPEVYKILYNDSIRINPNTIKMPKFDDTIRVYCNNQPAQELIFKGFRYKYNDEPSFIKDKNVIASYYLCYSSPNNDKPSKVPLSNLSMVINQDGDSLDGSIIRKSMLAGQLPVIDYAEMKLDLASMTIQIPKIDSIRTQNHANTAVQLFLIGLATDVILFDLWIHEMGRKLQ